MAHSLAQSWPDENSPLENLCTPFQKSCKQVAKQILQKIEEGLIDPNTMVSGIHAGHRSMTQNGSGAGGGSGSGSGGVGSLNVQGADGNRATAGGVDQKCSC